MREDYIQFFLNGRRDTAEIETLEITHPAFSRAYYIVRNVTGGISLTHEDGKEYFHEYYPLGMEDEGSKDDLDFGISINLGDLGEIIPDEIDNLIAADGFYEKPKVVYRSYRSDTLKMMRGPLDLEISDLSFTGEGSAFTAGAPRVNRNGTGLRYDFSRFPSLREFVK